MLNKEEHQFVIPCIHDEDFKILVCPYEDKNGPTRVVMTSINDKELEELNENGSVTINRGRNCFVVEKDNIFAYGEIDFTPNSEDIIKMEHMLDSYYFDITVPANYDYETHTHLGDNKIGTYFDTTNLKNILPYYHGCLNKPKSTIIFKYYLESVIIKKKRHKQLNIDYNDPEYEEQEKLKKEQRKEERRKQKLANKIGEIKLKIKKK